MTIRKFTALLKQGSVDVGCIQDQGGRDYQEDTVGFSELPEGKPAERFSVIVADGMGGMSSGAFVSDYTVKNLLAAEPDSPAEILAAVSRISGEIAAPAEATVGLPWRRCISCRRECISAPWGTAVSTFCGTGSSPSSPLTRTTCPYFWTG